MDIEYIIAFITIGSVVGYIISILFNSDNFTTVVNIITGTLGAILAGSLIPNTLLIKPLIIEYLIKATIGAVLLLMVMALIRKV